MTHVASSHSFQPPQAGREIKALWSQGYWQESHDRRNVHQRGLFVFLAVIVLSCRLQSTLTELTDVVCRQHVVHRIVEQVYSASVRSMGQETRGNTVC